MTAGRGFSGDERVSQNERTGKKGMERAIRTVPRGLGIVQSCRVTNLVCDTVMLHIVNTA